MTKQPEIMRHCWFSTAIPSETIWKHLRAKEDMKYELVEVQISIHSGGGGNELNFQIYDGFVYSHWGSFPNIFDQSTLGIAIHLGMYQKTMTIPLNNWECKEVTMSMFNNYATTPSLKFCAILWFYEVPMSKQEVLEYALKHPKYKYPKGSRKTAEPEEL